MGASDFYTTGRGRNAQKAFNTAREQALHEYGHGGYTGSLAEKSDFVKINRTCDDVQDAIEIAHELINKNDRRVSDKWGPAGCIFVSKDAEGIRTYVFFGIASE